VIAAREQILTLSHRLVEHGAVDMPQIQPRRVAAHLPIEWRVPTNEGDREAKLAGEEVARCFDIRDEQLRFGGGQNGYG
jgi:hypothetical protein